MSENKRPQWLRRDFLVGSAAGGVAVAGALGWKALRGGPAGFPADANPSYAQAGEDVIAAGIFHYLGIPRPTYLDVGAFLPVCSNNTYLFYRKGCRGVLVEPNVDLIPALRAARPGDTVLNVGVGLGDQTSADYYRLSAPQLNTFDRAEAERWVTRPGVNVTVKIEGVVRMPLVPLNRIMAEHFPRGGPDFLSIDIETLDLAVLRTVDFDRFRPRVICTETLVAETFRTDPATTEFLATKGYDVRGMTVFNTLYVDRAVDRRRPS